MGFNIAVAGKGGTGKTTVAGFVIRHLLTLGKGRVLAVDADANRNLNEVLGVPVHQTIGEIREGLGSVPPGMTKDAYINYRTQECLIEADGFDLIVMGRPEGPGCYCYANTLCKKYVDEMADNYAYVVLDNEAGMEHLSRRTTDAVDHLVVVAEATAPGALTARRLLGLSERLPITVRGKSVLWNKVTDP
ncbi:MAG: AAA family ATPase, partial [Proteobacteria bacterium]|nr:AAA family ATPase [Pseudomonadota bacterium]